MLRRMHVPHRLVKSSCESYDVNHVLCQDVVVFSSNAELLYDSHGIVSGLLQQEKLKLQTEGSLIYFFGVCASFFY